MRALCLFVAVGACGYSPPRGGSDDSPGDATGDDAAVVDDARPVVCPPAFVQLPGLATFHFIMNNSDDIKRWDDAELLCEAKGTDIHLAVIDDVAEADAIAQQLSPTRKYWVGIVQQPGQMFVSDGWTNITGGEAVDHWGAGAPDDGAGFGNFLDNDTEQFAAITSTGFLFDEPTSSKFWICECDGKPRDPTVVIPP